MTSWDQWDAAKIDSDLSLHISLPIHHTRVMENKARMHRMPSTTGMTKRQLCYLTNLHNGSKSVYSDSRILSSIIEPSLLFPFAFSKPQITVDHRHPYTQHLHQRRNRPGDRHLDLSIR